MKMVWVVLRREYLERVKTKGFVIGTLLIPILGIGWIAVMALFGSSMGQSGRTFAILDYTGELGEAVRDQMSEFGYEAEIVDSETPLEEMDARVREEEIDAYLMLDAVTLREGAYIYRSGSRPGPVRIRLLDDAITGLVLDRRLAFVQDGEEIRRLIAGSAMEIQVVRPEGESEDADAVVDADIRNAVDIAVGTGGAILLYMSILIYGAYVMRAVMEEKQNRVVEIVISSLRPHHLMLGKVLGVGLMGLTQMSIWIGSAVLLATFALPLVAASFPEGIAGMVAAVQSVAPGFGDLALFAAFFGLGFFLFASLFAAAGAMCSREEEAQQVQMPLVMLLLIPFMMQMIAIDGGGPGWMAWAALFPFFSPIMMFPRAISGDAEPWMVGSSLVLMALALLAMAWVSGRIFKVGILAQGKRPTLKEIVRWVRAG